MTSRRSGRNCAGERSSTTRAAGAAGAQIADIGRLVHRRARFSLSTKQELERPNAAAPAPVPERQVPVRADFESVMNFSENT